ncbi:cyclic nucleotide-binding domain-containing protein [bacterium]|nr:cyclic nucleotide-binding domain-containing protein [bacterium]MCI0606354.1 cyclic nucleotide-binding domain-containing protein [bacterium]
MEDTSGSPDQNSIEINNELISLDDFCDLGGKLLEQDMYEEAVSLYETATKLFPDSLAIKLNLGRAQDLQRKKELRDHKDFQANIEKLKAEDDLLAQRYLSLATLYYSRGKIVNAIELLELSKFKNENVSRTRYLLGKIYSEQGDTGKALEEFLKARELDPFYEDIHKNLGGLYYERQEYDQAMEAFVDAYILSGGEDIAKTGYYQRQIRMLLSHVKAEDKKEFYNRRFQERKNHFLQLANSFTAHKEVTLDTLGPSMEPILLKFRDMEKATQTSFNLVVELKKFPILQGLSDEELLRVARITTERSIPANEVVFQEDDLTEAIYFIHDGSVRIMKPTPFGEQLLASMKSGEFFGEMDFIDSLRCSATAVANEDCLLLSMSKLKLEDIFISQKHIAVQFYWHFWKTLAQRIRQTTDLLKSFFVEAGTEVQREMPEGRTGEATRVDIEKKIALLKEKGLSSKELRLIATFSNEVFFQAGHNIFLEGQKGDRLYIILEGQVLISKYIPGVGEEGLAILEKGDFFGEMALIDNAPRSADARAHTDVTLLPIENQLLTDMLSRDVESGYQFLYILCKILSRRLREINMKIYQWRIMSGGFS